MLATVVLATCMGVLGLPRPEVYYITSPTLSNETLMVAGAGLNTSTSVRLCRDSACLHPVDAKPKVWDRSIQITLPATGCGPPCFLHVESPPGNLEPIAFNAPDVWFVTPGSPSAYGLHTATGQGMVTMHFFFFKNSIGIKYM